MHMFFKFIKNNIISTFVLKKIFVSALYFDQTCSSHKRNLIQKNISISLPHRRSNSSSTWSTAPAAATRTGRRSRRPSRPSSCSRASSTFPGRWPCTSSTSWSGRARACTGSIRSSTRCARSSRRASSQYWWVLVNCKIKVSVIELRGATICGKDLDLFPPGGNHFPVLYFFRSNAEVGGPEEDGEKKITIRLTWVTVNHCSSSITVSDSWDHPAVLDTFSASSL